MGNCFSDIEGGKQAVGGVQRGPMAASGGADSAAHNDAVDYFYQVQGFQPLFTQIEVDFGIVYCLLMVKILYAVVVCFDFVLFCP